MASVNKAIIVGNLGRDPELRYLSDGQTAVTTLNVATTRRVKQQDDKYREETEWHHVILFRRQAGIAKDYLHKGSAVYVEGRIQTRKWQDKDGVDRWTTEIIGEVMQLLDRKSDGQGQQSHQSAAQSVDAYGEAPF